MTNKDSIRVMVTDLHDALIVYGTLNQLKGALAVIDFDLDDDDNKFYEGPRSEIKGYTSSTSDEMDVFYIGRQVFLKIFDHQRGIMLYKGTITYSLTNLLHIEKLVFCENIQRRNNVKVKVRFKGEIYPIKVEQTNYGDEIEQDFSSKKAVLFQDISAGGCCFFCKSLIEVGSVFQMNFNRISTPFPLSFTVLRRSPIVPDKEWSYGCQFLKMTAAEEMLIRQYVFKEIALAKRLSSSDR